MSDFARGGRYLGLPSLKIAGALEVNDGEKRITIIPSQAE